MLIPWRVCFLNFHTHADIPWKDGAPVLSAAKKGLAALHGVAVRLGTWASDMVYLEV